MWKKASFGPLNSSSKSSTTPCSVPPGTSHATAVSTSQKQGNGVKVEKQGVYLILWELNMFETTYHWGILVATSETAGVLFHQTNRNGDPVFRYEKIVDKDLTRSISILCLLKIGAAKDVTIEEINVIEQCVLRAQVLGRLTCRTWVLAAVFQLASERLIGIQASLAIVNYLEIEAINLAEQAKSGARFLVRRGFFCVP